MIERKTVLDQIEITRRGTVQVRIALLLVDNGVEIGCKYHRSAIEEPSAPNAATLQMYEVNRHLVSMGELPVDQVDIDKIIAHTELVKK